jgi:tRNA pseudouridine38-40 synthase
MPTSAFTAPRPLHLRNIPRSCLHLSLNAASCAVSGALPTVVVKIQYNGAAFHGWERKPGLRTVQGTLESALASLQPIYPPMLVSAASKTDRGTHAAGQVASFVPSVTHSGSWRAALNARLPTDVVVVSCANAPRDFDARSDAQWRRYRYTILTSREPSVFLRELVWHFYQAPLDVRAMNEAASYLAQIASEAPRDMSAFRKTKSPAAHTDIQVYASSVTRPRPHVVELEVRASWFVHGMMRLLAAALVEVGRGAMSVVEFRRIVETGDRESVKHSAPAAGLCLLEVGYLPGVCPLVDADHHALGLSDFCC